MKDVKTANDSLPDIGVCSKDGRLDLLFANISFDVGVRSPAVMPCLIHLEDDYPMSAPNVGFPVPILVDMHLVGSLRGSSAFGIGCTLSIGGNAPGVLFLVALL